MNGIPSRGKKRHTASHCLGQDLPYLTLLLPYYTSDINAKNANSNAMLECAATLGRDGMVRRLLQEGANEFYLDPGFFIGSDESAGEDKEGGCNWLRYDEHDKVKALI